jgi:membrane glycosyltransferase
VVGALVLSIPLSVWSSRVSLGQRFRRWRMFLVPEESNPPYELRCLHEQQRKNSKCSGFVQAVADPLVNAVVCATNSARARRHEAFRSERQALVDAALAGGPDALSPRQKLDLLDDPSSLSALHHLLWSTDARHPAWNETTGEKTC